uniref:hypothetical protein n=1 Tax=Cognatilysobacter terrigena TaxID=2488749 RepID=UPI001AADDD3A
FAARLNSGVSHLMQVQSRMKKRFRFPLPTSWQLQLKRSRIERGYGREIAAARGRRDYPAVQGLEDAMLFELNLQEEEEDSYLTGKLLSKARKLRVPSPHIRREGEELSGAWYEGNQTGGWYLSPEGVKALREEIRQEERARREQNAHLAVWLSAVTGLVGALTGLVVVFAKSNG